MTQSRQYHFTTPRHTSTHHPNKCQKLTDRTRALMSTILSGGRASRLLATFNTLKNLSSHRVAGKTFNRFWSNTSSCSLRTKTKVYYAGRAGCAQAGHWQGRKSSRFPLALSITHVRFGCGHLTRCMTTPNMGKWQIDAPLSPEDTRELVIAVLLAVA